MSEVTKFIKEDDVLEYTNGGTARPAGDVVELPCGKAGVVGPRGLAANERGYVRVEGLWRFPAVSAGALNAGVTVGWHNTNGNVVASASGDFDIGTVFATKADGTDEILVLLNA